MKYTIKKMCVLVFFQWKWHPAIYITYRIIVASYSVACFLALMLTAGSARSFAYLTIWTYLILCLYQISALFSCIFCHIFKRGISGTVPTGAILMKSSITSGQATELALQNPSYSDDSTKLPSRKGSGISNGYTESEAVKASNSKQTPAPKDRTVWYMKLTWLLASILYVFGFVVTVVYFAAVHQGGTNIHDLNVHAFNTVQILIDIAIVARPVRLLHVIYPILYGLCYIIFSVIFWFQDKENNVLYPNVIDWNHPGTTAVVVTILAIVGIPIVHLALFGLYQLRLYIYKRIYDTGSLE